MKKINVNSLLSLLSKKSGKEDIKNSSTEQLSKTIGTSNEVFLKPEKTITEFIEMLDKREYEKALTLIKMTPIIEDNKKNQFIVNQIMNLEKSRNEAEEKKIKRNIMQCITLIKAEILKKNTLKIITGSIKEARITKEELKKYWIRTVISPHIKEAQKKQLKNLKEIEKERQALINDD